MPSIGELVIDIKASTASIQTDMTKLQGTMASSSAAIVSSLNKIVTVMVVDIGQKAVRAIAGWVEKTVEAGDRIGRLSVQTGLSTEALSKYAYAAKIADVDIETFSAGMSRLAFKLTDAANGNQKLRAEFMRFGIDPTKIRDPEQALLKLNEAFSRLYEGDKARVIGASIEFFSRAGFRLLPFLTMAPERLQALAAELQAMGGVWTAEDVAKTEAIHDDLKRLDAAWEALAKRLLMEAAPAIERTTEAMVALMKDPELINNFVSGLAAGIKWLAEQFIMFRGTIRNTIAEIQLAKDLWAATKMTRGEIAESVRAAVEEAAGGPAAPRPKAKETSDAVTQALDTYHDKIAKNDDDTQKWLNRLANPPKMSEDMKRFLGGGGEQAIATASAVDKIIKKLDEEAATYKMVATQVQLVKAIEAGASEAQLDHIVAQIAHLDELQGIYNDMARRTRAGVAPYGPLDPAAMNQLLGIEQQMIPATDQLDESAYRARETMFNFYKGALTWEEKWQIETEQIVELWRLYPELGDMAARAIDAQNKGWAEHANTGALLVRVQRDISQSLADAIFNADSFGDAMNRLLLKIAETIFQMMVLDPLLDKLFKKKEAGGGGAGVLGMIGSFFGGLFGLQGGGNFAAGRPFIAGEAGPELIYPGISGTVIPNHALGGQTVYNIDARGADPTVEFRIRRALRESEQRSVARSVSTTREMGLRNVT